MIFLTVLALLFSPLEGRFVNRLQSHLSGSLRLKCDALPYRTAFVKNRCFFAVNREVKLNEASAQCSSVLPGSKIDVNVPDAIFNAMMLDKPNFHTGKDSLGAKHSICVHDSGYTCDVGEQSSTVPGKCLESSDIKRNFANAESYCAGLGMALPTVENELENHMIRAGIAKDFAWLQHVYNGATTRKWSREKYYSKFSTCHRSHVLYAGADMKENNPYVFPLRMVSVIDKTGYWGFNDVSYQYGTVCIKDAESDFNRVKKLCVANHKLDEETGLCEWTGPKDACLQVFDVHNKTGFVRLPNFPLETWTEEPATGEVYINDLVTKVIVRRGCLYTGYSGYIEMYREVMAGNDNVGYGEHKVPNYHTGDLPGLGDGLSLIKCLCDPTEANLNDHVPPPPKKKCVEHHAFNETTQSCEWIHDPKYCAELTTNDGRRQMIEMPKYPKIKKYDVDHYVDKGPENFHVTVTEAIVRQHCWLTLIQGSIVQQGAIRQLPTAGYGKHTVKSFYNGKLASTDLGMHRVLCECIR